MVEFKLDNSSQLHREIKELVTMACGRWNESTELVSNDTTVRIMAAINAAMVRENREIEQMKKVPPINPMFIEELKQPLAENAKRWAVMEPGRPDPAMYFQDPPVEDRVQRTRDIWEVMRCPECRAGKHPNCTEKMLDLNDRQVWCMCYQVGHTIPSWQ